MLYLSLDCVARNVAKSRRRSISEKSVVSGFSEDIFQTPPSGSKEDLSSLFSQEGSLMTIISKGSFGRGVRRRGPSEGSFRKGFSGWVL